MGRVVRKVPKYVTYNLMVLAKKMFRNRTSISTALMFGYVKIGKIIS